MLEEREGRNSGGDFLLAIYCGMEATGVRRLSDHISVSNMYP